MAQQSFFHQTPHTNLGLMFTAEELESGDAQFILDDVKTQATALDEGNKNIFRVIAQASSNHDGLQIFIAPYVPYKEIAEKLLDCYEYTHKIYLTDKHGVKRLIRKSGFVEGMDKIIRTHPSNRPSAIKMVITLIKTHYEKDINALTKAVEKIGKDNNMGVVKHQCYYSGLAHTWIEHDDQKKAA